tara:strand:- start:1139 stop:2353 length:1215 start_codon:yes stop_codon:yes gene_type:complete
MGSIVKGVASLFGGRARRREQKQANQALDKTQGAFDSFRYDNIYEGMQAPEFQDQLQGVDTTAALAALTAGQNRLAGLQQDPAKLATQRDAVTTAASMQKAEQRGYTAGQTNVGGLQRGADAGLTNTMRNLQVSTAGAEMAAQEADQALAASQDLAAQAGTGAGGATALAAQAAKSKAKIASDIDQQVKRNELLRAQGESELQRSQLGQENLASKFDLGQQQFNVGQANQAERFSADAFNRAEQFNAGQFNRMSMFDAQAQNQFSRDAFGAGNRLEQFNAQQDTRMAELGARFDLQSANVQTDAAKFAATTNNQYQVDLNNRKFAIDQATRNFEFKNQQRELDVLETKNDRALARKQAADAARAQAKSDLIGGIAGVASAAIGGFGGAGGFSMGKALQTAAGNN